MAVVCFSQICWACFFSCWHEFEQSAEAFFGVFCGSLRAETPGVRYDYALSVTIACAQVMEDIQRAMNSKDVVALGMALKEAERLNVEEVRTMFVFVVIVVIVLVR